MVILVLILFIVIVLIGISNAILWDTIISMQKELVKTINNLQADYVENTNSRFMIKERINLLEKAIFSKTNKRKNK